MSKIAIFKNLPKTVFFSKKLSIWDQWQFLGKIDNFRQLFLKISSFWQFLDIQMSILPRIRFDVTV